MAKKTVRERPSIFRRTDTEIPELEPMQPPEQTDIQTSRNLDIQEAKPERIKATFHLNPEDILAIDHMQAEEFKRTRKKPERSQIVSRALQLLLQQHYS
jgi:hypothetical protein